ncbi:MAG: hypothetical protein QXV69_04050 [Sulfolobaceae archaeon]
MFWEYYRKVEKGLSVPIEDFKYNIIIKEEVKEGIRGLMKILEEKIKKITNKNNIEEGLVELLSNSRISPALYQEMVDILRLYKKLDVVEDEILYSMLVRILEDIEELYTIIGSH